jgi:hypothetical protein
MNLVRRAATVAAALSLSLLLGVAPGAALAARAPAAGSASAAAGLPAWACSPADIAAGVGLTARGGIADSRGVIREKDLGQGVTPLPASAVGRAPTHFSATVPVYFHVITDGDLGTVTDAQIAAQIRVLNFDYAGHEGGADTGFNFDLAGVTRTDDAKWFASRSGGAERDMKKTLKQGGDDALNVYSTSGGLYLGWAYLPSVTDTNQSYLDGIVIDWRTIPGVSDAYAAAYDEGKTLTHESGHWLNLEHTFYNGCKDPGDFVDDTPAEKTPTSGCPAGKDTCPAPGLDPIHNYMDYSYDGCYSEFTPGQAARMQDARLYYRAP